MTTKEILNATPDQVRSFALKQLAASKWCYSGNTLKDELLRNTSLDDFEPAENFAELNLILDTRSCFGRTARCAAFAETYYNNDNKLELFAGDVIIDWFREVIGENMQAQILKHPEMLNDVLMYEDPHVVLIINGEQFDPLSKIMGFPVIHPKVEKYPVWEYIHSGMLCSVCISTDDIAVKKIALQRAAVYGSTIEYLYMLSHISILLDDIATVISTCEEILKKKKSARSMWVINSLNGKYKDELTKEYTSEVFNFFKSGYGL